MGGPLLAYVFWHAPNPSVAPAEYESGLRAFHASLAASPPPGFRGSVAYRAAKAPWTPSDLGPVVFVDWYLVDGWAELGGLVQHAISPPHQAPHDVVAPLLDRAHGGIYRRRVGDADLAEVRFDGWVGKAFGVPSPEFAEGLARTVDDPSVTVWQRQLALGPAPEFVRRSRLPPARPMTDELRVEVRPVLPGPPG